MKALVSTLTEEFHRKGLYPGLLPKFLRDIDVLINDNTEISRNRLNHELEDLGWGISVINHKIYERILKAHGGRHGLRSKHN
jgi:hypothetical protein